MEHAHWLEAVVADPAAALPDPDAARAIGETLAGRSFPAPPSLVAEPSVRAVAEVHLEGLERARAAGDAARARFHAGWLLHLLEPHDPRHFPLVSVVIPVYEAAHLVLDAVASALGQTWPHLEVVVVDDGSTDDPTGALADALATSRVRVVRQENRGVSAARNTGIAEARGDLIHFLDADDTLHSEAVEKKLAALRAVPDADLCVSRYRSVGADPGSRGAHGPGFGDAFCPTRDLLACWVRRYPFQTSTVLLPRWLLLETGPFEEDFPQGEDTRYWFRLALRGAKVAALDEPLAERRFREGSLSASESALGPILFTMGLAALLEEPARWSYVAPLAVRMQGRERWRWVDVYEDERLDACRGDLIDTLRRLPQVALDAGLSAAFPAVALKRQSVDATPHGPDGFLARLGAALVSAAARSLPLSTGDVWLWLGDAPFDENAAASELCLDELLARARRDALPPATHVVLAELDRRVPGDARARVLARFARAPAAWLGDLVLDRAQMAEPSTSASQSADDGAALDVVVVPDFVGPGAAVFEARTRVFLGSWIEHEGASRSWPLHLVCIGEPPPAVRALAERAGALLHPVAPLDSEQPYLNKLRGLEIPSRTGHILLVDADTVVLGDLSPALALGDAFAALPAATNRIPERVWAEVFAACDVAVPEERMLPLIAVMEDELPAGVMREPFREEIPLHWNSGVVLTPADSGLREAWEDAARTLKAAFAESEWERHVCGNDQPSLAVAAARLRGAGLAYRPMPPPLHGFDLFHAAGRLTFEDTRIYHAKTFLRRAKKGGLDLQRECQLYRSHLLPRLFPESRIDRWLRRLRRLPHPRRAGSAAALCDCLDDLVRRYAIDGGA